MRQLSVIVVLCFCSLALYGQKTRYGQTPANAKPGVDYPITMHITGLHIRTHCVYPWVGALTCGDVLYVDSVFDGIKIELMGDFNSSAFFDNLSPGDYQARLAAKNPGAILTSFGQKYELLLPNNAVWVGSITGYSELEK
jgi:hypothetical protein